MPLSLRVPLCMGSCQGPMCVAYYQLPSSIKSPKVKYLDCNWSLPLSTPAISHAAVTGTLGFALMGHSYGRYNHFLIFLDGFWLTQSRMASGYFLPLGPTTSIMLKEEDKNMSYILWHRETWPEESLTEPEVVLGETTLSKGWQGSHLDRSSLLSGTCLMIRYI